MREMESNQSEQATNNRYAAIDMGSNSFQLLILEYQKEANDDSCWKSLLQCKQRVQLAAGLDEHNRLTEPAMQKAIVVLSEFNQQIETFQPLQLRVVGTKALRQAINSADFLSRISQALHHSAEIIEGAEEARLIYRGVANTITNDKNKVRLVIDVGGGSTEFVVGQGNQPKLLDSLSLGCVSTQREFFAEGVITAEALKQAQTSASLKLLPLRNKLSDFQWQTAIGCSGVFEALLDVQRELISEKRLLTLQGLEAIYEKILEYKNSADIDLNGIGENRKGILPASLAIVMAIFRTLKISQLELSKAALKEGVIFELQNEQQANKFRQQTLHRLMEQYKVDGNQALRVLASVTDIWQQLSENWPLENPRNMLVLSWAALLHEVGLTISPHNYPAHGGYLISNTELPGFNKSQQLLLAALITGQSGEIPTELLHKLPEGVRKDSWRLLIALRLAKIIRANREESPPTRLDINADGTQLYVSMLASTHPDVELLWAALVHESNHQKQVGFEIALQGNLPLAAF